MPEILSFHVAAGRLSSLSDLRPALDAPTQVLGPVVDASGESWSAFVARDGSVRGVGLICENTGSGRRLDLRRDPCASSVDFALMEKLTHALMPAASSVTVGEHTLRSQDVDAFFDPVRTQAVRLEEWDRVQNRFFRMGRGRAVFTTPLYELTVNLEDVTFPGRFQDHLTDVEERLAVRVRPIVQAELAETIRADEERGGFTWTRWSLDTPTLTREVDRVLVCRGSARIGFIPSAELRRLLGPRAEFVRSRPPRWLLLPGLDVERDVALLALLERTARVRPPV